MKSTALKEILKSISSDTLMKLSRESEASTFSDDSEVRKIINDYEISEDGSFFTGLIGLRHLILVEVTRRFYDNLL